MLLAAAAAAALAVLMFTFFVRQQDLPQADTAGATPWKHLEGRKASIYENLRDLQFEFRLGKLSDEDYQRSKVELQAELATVLAEIDQLRAEGDSARVTSARKETKGPKYVCPSCGARFDRALKFCGECGKPMGAAS